MQINLKKWQDEILATLILAWPIILSNLAQMLINSTDVFLLGHYSEGALAASAIGTGIVITPLVIGYGLISASSAMIATQKGKMAHSVRDVRRTVRASMWIAILFSIPIMALLWFSEAIAVSMGIKPDLAKDVGIFVRALEFEIMPALLALSLRNFVTALHAPIWATLISVISVICNAIINYGLIFGNFGLPELGLFGAGLGSSITNLIALLGIVLVVALKKPFRKYYIFGNFWKIDWARMIKMLKIGAPISLQWGFEVSVFSGAVFLMGLISTQSAAGHAIAIQIVSMTFMVPMSIAQAATVRVGNAFGRKDKIAISYAGWSAFIMAMIFMSSTGFLIFIYAKPLAQLFIDKNVENSAIVIALAVGFIKIGGLFQIADGAQVVGAGMLRGLHDTKWAMIFAGIGYWGVGIGVGSYLAFVANMAGNGIWIGLAVGLAVVAALMITRWSMREKLNLC